ILKEMEKLCKSMKTALDKGKFPEFLQLFTFQVHRFASPKIDALNLEFVKLRNRLSEVNKKIEELRIINPLPDDKIKELETLKEEQEKLNRRISHKDNEIL